MLLNTYFEALKYAYNPNHASQDFKECILLLFNQ